MQNKSSIKTYILGTSLSMMAFGLLAIGGYSAWSRADMQEDMFQNKVNLTAQLALGGSSNAIWQFDAAMAKDTLAPATSDPDFRAGVIFNEKRQIFYSIGDQTVIDAIAKAGQSTLNDNLLVKSMPLSRTEENKVMTIGEMAVVFDTGAAAQRSLNAILMMVAVAFGVLFTVGAALYFMLERTVRPIVSLSGVMSRMAEGSFDQSVPGVDRNDEIGQMAHAVEVLKDNSLKARALEKETADMRTKEELGSAREQERIVREAGQLRDATEMLGAALKRLAHGDLTSRIDKSLSSEYESIRSDFNQAVDQLREAIVSVRNSVGNIDAGTSEIANSANSLSKRTEQQAAALEEAAAALDQITANVASSKIRTEQARSVSGLANKSAVQSLVIVSSAEEAMQRIEKSSEQISSIISVIDEIAFQTNLLALNAGVEAARAGDAGKGFAVVAQEVRELAQRSAQAAKEIKNLIHNSATEVDEGVRLVRETGEALKGIGKDIVEINQHMEAIATATREQSSGLAEINTAVNHMDQSTQQNAAMVEESSAASAALAGEASRLREQVSVFVVDDGVKDLRDMAQRMASPHSFSQRDGGKMRVARSSVASPQWSEF